MSADYPMSGALDLYRARVKAYDSKVQSREEISSELVRETARALVSVLRSYCLPENWQGEYGSSPKVPLPPEIADDIARNIHIICDGHIPKWILQLQRRGTAPADPRVRTGQGYAVAYVKLCQAGSIKKRASTATVAKAFGVDRRTAQYWVSTTVVEPDDFCPEATSDEVRAQLITEKMFEAGKLYKTWGLSPKKLHPFGQERKRPRAKRARI